MLLKPLSDSTIEATHKELWANAITQYGSEHNVPGEIAGDISEMTRGMFVLSIWARDGSTGNPVKFMNTYSIQESVIKSLAEIYCGEVIENFGDEIKTERRADKWAAFEKWALENVFAQFTTEQLTAQAGFSYQTTLKYVQGNPTFRTVKKGLWEVRDAKADRLAGN